MQTALDFIAELTDISDAALDLLDAGGVADLPVVWNDKLRTSAGRCLYWRPDVWGEPRTAVRIELNPKLLQEGPEALRNTFLHELAHAIANRGASHGPAWKRAHRTLGGSAQPCHTFASMAVTRKLVGRCERCGWDVLRSRSLSLKSYTHRRCGGRILRIDAAGRAQKFAS